LRFVASCPLGQLFIILWMSLAGRAARLAVVFVCLGGLVACGTTHTQSTVAKKLTYSRRQALQPESLKHASDRAVNLETLSYVSSDGSRVPALLAKPVAGVSRGCLMYQGGIGQTKEQTPALAQGATTLGLSTFTIDPRDTGPRGGPDKLREDIDSPTAMARVINDSVVDLRRGIDYLETRRECRHNIAFLGTSFGAVLGAIVAAQDPRIKAVILTSIGPTWRSALLANNQAKRSDPSIPFVLLPGIDKNAAKLNAAVRVLAPYDPAKWVVQISPRPVLIINGRSDPLVPPIDALDLADAAQQPKSVMYFDGGHDPFAPGPDTNAVVTRVARFLCGYLNSCPVAF
jgi:pimeloyl-ACP methyl ester carboxylesterase